MVRTGAALGQTVRVDADEELVFLNPDSAEQEPARVRPRRWLWPLLAAALVGGVVVQANRHPSAPAAAPSTRSSAFSEVAPAPKTSEPVTVTQLGQSILGATGGWTLFGRGPGVLVRIVPATGQIDSTVVPSLQSGGPVSFVPAAGEAIIRSIDFVPGYVVPDGQPARRLPAGFGSGGPIFPGPDAGHLWVDSGDNEHPILALTALDGSATGTVLRLQAGHSSLEAVGDGAGYLLLTSSDGVYRVQPGRVRRISSGSLVATGPTGWLVAECDQQQHCRQVLIDRSTGRRRILGPETPNGGSRAPWGAISPDGRTAAVFDVGSDGYNTIELLDLRTGSLLATRLDLEETVNDGTIVWSPDSRWLFAVDRAGGVIAYAPGTGQIQSMPGPLPPLTQLAVRTDG